MSAAEVLSEEEENGNTSVRGDDVDEDEEGSNTISFVMHDCFFLVMSYCFLSVLCVCGHYLSVSIALKFSESCKHVSRTLVMSSISTNFMHNVLCS